MIRNVFLSDVVKTLKFQSVDDSGSNSCSATKGGGS